MAVKIPNMSIPPGQVSFMGVTQTIPQPFVTDYSSTFVTYGLSLLMVLVPAPRVLLWFFRFSSLCKNQHSKFQFDPEMRATGLSALLLSVTLK